MKHLQHTENGWLECPGYRKKVLLNADDLNADGALVQLVAIPPKAKVSLHHHQRMTEVFHVLSGEGWVSIAGAKHHLHTGDTVTCEPDGRNTARNEEDGPYQHIVFKTSWSEDDIYWEDEIEPD